MDHVRNSDEGSAVILMVNGLKKAIMLAAVSLLIVHMAFSESYGNISLQDWNQRISTGLWGATLPTTTSTTVATNATTTTLIVTGSSGSATTTTLVNSTTTTSISSSATATTIASSSPAEGTYKIEHAEKLITADQVSSLIGSDVLLSSAIESLSGKPSSSIDLKATEEMGSSVSIAKTLVAGVPSKLSITIIYLGEKEVKDFIIFDRVPKTFAQNVDLLTINTNVKKSIVETDPSIAYFAPMMKKYDMIVIEYSVNSNVSQEALEQSETYVFTMGYASQEIPLLWIILPVVILAAVGAVLFVFRDQIPDLLSGSGKKKKRVSGEQQKKTLKELFEKMKNALKGKKEDPKFVYKTENDK